MDKMLLVIIGHRSSKSTFGANKRNFGRRECVCFAELGAMFAR